MNKRPAIANIIAALLLVTVSATSALVIIHSGNEAKTSYESVSAVTTISKATSGMLPVNNQASASTISVENSATASIQAQPQNMVNQLQPTLDMSYSATYATNYLQPSLNIVQQPSINPQSAASIL
jgi:hypothetical protein